MPYMDELISESKKAPGKSVFEELEKGEEAKPPEGEEAPQGEEAEKTLIASYGNVKIFKVAGQSMLQYNIAVPRPAGPEKELINTVKEAATRLITIAPAEIEDPQRRRDFYFKRIREIIESSPELHVPVSKIDFYAEWVMREMIGYGILDTLLKDDKLEEIMVIGPNRPVFVFHREYEMMTTNIVFGSDADIYGIIDRIAREVGRRVDIQNPLLDARLPDGSRVNATIRPVSLEGSTLTIRKFREEPFTVVDLITKSTVSVELAAYLWMAVDGLGAKPANILVSGGTGSGKTTTLNVLASFVPTTERVITIEDTAELKLPVEHWIRFETRPPSIEGTGEITMDVLVKNSLRMRPDRIIVGEVRHAEAFTLLTAINTGHDGCMGTVHANSALETLTRLMNPPMSVPAIMIGALDFIVVQQKIYDRRKGTIRRVTEVAEVEGVIEDKPQIQTLFEWDAATDSIKYTGVPSRYEQKLMRFTGMSKADIEAELEKRKEYLDGLVKQGTHEIKEVEEALRSYYQKGEEVG